MNNKLFLITLIVIACMLCACTKGNTYSKRINYTSTPSVEHEVSPQDAKKDEGITFIEDFYSETLKPRFGTGTFKRSEYLTDRFAFATYECDWDIFLYAQDFPEHYDVFVEKYKDYDNRYLVKIETSEKGWESFNNEFVIELVREDGQLLIDNIFYLHDDFGAHWLANYSIDNQKRSESIIHTPNGHSFEFSVWGLDGWGHQIREDFDGDKLKENLIIWNSDMTLDVDIRKNGKTYDLFSIPNFVSTYDVNTFIQFSFYDIDTDGEEELFIASRKENINESAIYAYKMRDTTPIAYEQIIDRLSGYGEYIIEENRIYIPHSSQTIKDMYVFSNGKLEYAKKEIKKPSAEEINLDFLYE